MISFLTRGSVAVVAFYMILAALKDAAFLYFFLKRAENYQQIIDKQLKNMYNININQCVC